MNAGNLGTFEKDKSRVIESLSQKASTTLDLSEELKLTPGYAAAIIFHIDRHERFDMETIGTGRERTYAIL